MVLARWQSTIVDTAGNVQPGASVRVEAELPGSPLASLYSDRAGTVAIGNPITAGTDGSVGFHVIGGAYKITATLGAFSQTFRYVAVGRAAESDALSTGLRYRFDSSVVDADPGAGLVRFNNATLASVTSLFVDLLSDDAVDLTAVLDSWDDGGASANRGVLTVEQSGTGAFFIATVTGSIAAPAGYRKVVVTPIATAGTFAAGQITSLQFTRSGIDTSGDVVGPASAVTGDIATYNGTTGKLIQDGGKTITTVAAGKQSIWVPASAMILPGGGAAAAVLTTNQLTSQIIAFDPTSFEAAFFSIKMPKSWDVGTITFRAVWSHAATVTNFGVMWQLTGVPLSDGDLLTTVITDSASQVDTGGVTDTIYISPESGALTMGTPARAAEDLVTFRAGRLATDGADTLAIDARLHGFMLFYTTNANTDA